MANDATHHKCNDEDEDQVEANVDGSQDHKRHVVGPFRVGRAAGLTGVQ